MKKSKRGITKQMQHNPDHVTATPTNESPAIREARQQQAKAAEAAQQACSAAEAAQQAVEQATQALTKKETHVSEVRAEFEAVGERLARMPLDDPDSERVGGRHRHLELVLKRVEGEHGGCHETLLTAQRRAEDAARAAEVAEAALRNAQRQVTLQRLCEAFPVALEKLLDLIRGRNQVLGEADQEAQVHDLPRLGRFRLLPAQDQLQRHESYELATILTRHEAGLVVVPSASLAAFSMQSENGKGVSDAEVVSPDDIPDPEDLTEEEWLLLTTGAPIDE